MRALVPVVCLALALSAAEPAKISKPGVYTGYSPLL